MTSVAEIFARAHRLGIAIPAFNIPYLPMMEPVVRAVKEHQAFALVETARLEWTKFESRGTAFVAAEFARWGDPAHVRLHLDHVPVIDEDGLAVDTLPIFSEALAQGYESVMIDGSRLPLEENIRATRKVVELAHAAGVPVEAELGAVLGHEAGPLPSYEELFTSGRGFTDVQEAQRFVAESGCDWLSVAIGNVHGAVAQGRRDQKKIEARLNLERLAELDRALGIPLVLHGGSGIRAEDARSAVKLGITKVNVGTEIRQAYEVELRGSGSIPRAQAAVRERTGWLLSEYFGVAGLRKAVVEDEPPGN